MRVRTPLLSVLLLSGLLLTACTQQSAAPTVPSSPAAQQPATPGLSRSIGRVEVTFSGVGSTFYATSVRDLTPGLTGQALTRAASGLQLRFTSKGSFDVGAPGTGTRYLHATYDVRNASFDGATPSSTPRSNLTFIAVDATAPATIAGSAVRNLKRFDGSAADPALATSITPLHGMMSAGGVPTVNPSLADFMAFTEAEASSLGAVADVTSVLPYGYVVRSKLSSADRTLPAEPGAGQFDGQVTFAVKLPLQANSANDPFTFSLVFEVVEDSQTRITKTAEESVSAAQSRATTLGAIQVSADTVCRVRVTGSAAAPTSVLTGLGTLGGAGSLDGCFGTGGKVITPVGSGSSGEVLTATSVQSDGKIVAAGYAFQDLTGNDFALTRYTSDGVLDPTFGTGGQVVTPVGPTTSSDGLSAMSVQPDGKIVVAGGTENIGSGTDYDFALARYTADGSLDPSFGNGGKVITPVGPTISTDGVAGMSLQADGKIVVAGHTSNSGAATGRDFAVVRYNPDGTLDPTFGTGGRVITPMGATNTADTAQAITIQPDGKIVVVGYAFNGRTAGEDFALVRYNTDGTLDTTFGTGGKVFTGVGGSASNDQARAVSLQPDGKFVVAGITQNRGGTTGQDVAVVRYTASGTLDTTFGTGGKLITPLGTTNVDEAVAVSTQPDGKIVVAGYTRDFNGSTGYDAALIRYAANGTLDSTFGTAGTVILPVGNGASVDLVYAMTVQADGKIVAAGYTFDSLSPTGIDFALVRVLP